MDEFCMGASPRDGARVNGRERAVGGRTRGSGATRRPKAPLAAGVMLALLIGAAPSSSWACACGCGMFDIGANTAFPNMSDSGWSAWVRVNYLNQDKNWEGASQAPASDNLDKKIKTWFYTLGGQYMFSNNWGVMVEAPIFQRSFTTTGDGSAAPAGSITTTDLTALGDIMVQGVYSGFSPDMSTGVTFGVKLPTGDYTGPFIPANGLPPGNPNSTTGGLAYDRDTLPGTGSTDVLIGAYHVGGLTRDNRLSYFAQARYDIAVFTRDGATGSYRPGSEVDGSVGLAYDTGKHGAFDRIAPVMQLLGSWRQRDSGTAASLNSGYRRLLIGPGIDMRIGKTRIFMDAEVPVLQYVKTDVATSGNVGQLTASVVGKVQVAYDF